MKINALDLNEKQIVVEIDPAASRHIIVNGEEVSSDLRKLHDHSLERQVENALDSLYDLPIFEDGKIRAGNKSSVWVWQEATIA